MEKSRISLVGAGPWDPGLLTLKGKSRLEAAEVVLYDDLVNPSLFAHLPKRAKKIYVGKRGGSRSTPQDQIHRLLLRYAKKGKRVVRLKGGDPFLFGRGAEEVAFLAKHGIPFEVIPGVTSALACPAYAGIPLTDRNCAKSVGIFTGTERGDKRVPPLRWEISKGLDTLVFLMGVRHLPEIVGKLTGNGRPGTTPCALIQWGTSRSQKTVVGTLKTILRLSRNVTSPAVFVVGEVVRLRRHLNWYESAPLFGKRILVTRPKGQGEAFGKLLEAEGAEVVYLPTSEIVPLGKEEDLAPLFSRLGEYDWCFLNSVNGVRIFLSTCREYNVSRRKLRRLRFAAIGPKTKEALQEGGLFVKLMPKVFTQEGLLARIREKRIPLRGKRILLFHARGARKHLASSLKKRGALVKTVTLYAARKTDFPVRPIREALQKRKIDIITFTSGSCVEHFFEFFPGSSPKELLNGTQIAAIGPVTAKRCQKQGLRVTIQAGRHTSEGLLEAIVRHETRSS